MPLLYFDAVWMSPPSIAIIIFTSMCKQKILTRVGTIVDFFLFTLVYGASILLLFNKYMGKIKNFKAE